MFGKCTAEKCDFTVKETSAIFSFNDKSLHELYKFMSKLNIILPVLGSVFIGIRDEVASWLGIVMILRWGQDQGWQISCKIITQNIHPLITDLFT